MDDRLVAFGTDLLADLNTRLTLAGITLPTTQYVHSGEIVYDFTEGNCADALIVSFSGFVEGGAGTTGLPGTAIKCAVPLVSAWTIALVRCVPALTDDGAMPSPIDLENSATELLYDAMELANAVVDIYLGEGTCLLKSIGTVTPIGPEGAAGGNVVTVFAEMA